MNSLGGANHVFPCPGPQLVLQTACEEWGPNQCLQSLCSATQQRRICDATSRHRLGYRRATQHLACSGMPESDATTGMLPAINIAYLLWREGPWGHQAWVCAHRSARWRYNSGQVRYRAAAQNGNLHVSVPGITKFHEWTQGFLHCLVRCRDCSQSFGSSTGFNP